MKIYIYGKQTVPYLYLTFSMQEKSFNLDDYIFNTEDHPFKKRKFDKGKARMYLGLK